MVRRLWSGAGNAMLAAVLWALFYWSVIVDGVEPLPALLAAVLESVVRASWFVLPTGCVVGAFMPRWVGQRRGREAVVNGVVIGSCVGLVSALGFLVTVHLWFPVTEDSWRPPWQDVIKQWVGMAALLTPWCALYVGNWAWRWSDVPRAIIPAHSPP